MRKISRWLTVGVCSVCLASGLALAKQPNVRNRQKAQQKRIVRGARSGELTRPEVRRLERNQVRIHRSIVRDRRDGGAFTPRERVKAQKKLNRQSRSIYRQKHDGQSR